MKRNAVWMIVVLNTLLVLARFFAQTTGISVEQESAADLALPVFVTIMFSFFGALIVRRTDGNRVGWLMLLLGFALANPFAAYLSYITPLPEGEPSFLVYFAYWTQGWFYFVILYCVFLILLHFPDGKPPTPRWNIVNVVSIASFAIYILGYTFQPIFGDEGWQIANPIALLSVPASETIFGIFLGIFGLIFLGIGSVASIFVRYRRAGVQTRAQIRWLLFASVVVFSGIGYRLAVYQRGQADWTSYLLPISLFILLVSIATAILRYRLYDIDIIIRRTLQYALLTGILAVVFFGGVVMLQGLFQGLTGNDNSPLVTVISTLLIAALFNPLRIRIQDWIDRRFYRAKYDAEKALEDFSMAARDEVDMDRLSHQLLRVVSETVRPNTIRLHLKETNQKQGR